VFDLDEGDVSGGRLHFGRHGLGQHSQKPLQSRVERWSLKTVLGLDVGVGVLEFRGPDHGVFVVVESGGQVAVHVVHVDRVVTRTGVVDVGFERSDGFHLVEMVLGEH